MDKQDPIQSGLVLLQDEADELILIKWLAWLVVMVLFVMILIWFTGYFETEVCDFGITSL